MLFYLDDSILNFLNNPDVRLALNSLATARRQGKHVIHASRNVFETLEKCKDLDKSSIYLYKKIHSTAFNIKNIVSKINRKIILVGEDDVFERIEDGSNINFKISIKWFDNIDLLVESYLLIEDEDESKVYDYIGKYYLNYYGMNNLILNYTVLHGGGDNICDNFARNTSKKDRLILALVDTDKLSPFAQKGITCNRITDYYKNHKDSIIAELLVCEKYHEVENLIPIKCYVEEDDSRRGSKCKEVAITMPITESSPMEWQEFALKVMSHNRDDIWCYYDFKKGLRIKHLKNQLNRKYWEEVFDCFDIDVKITIDWSNLKEEDKEKILIKGFGDKILKFVYPRLEHNKDVNEILSEYFEQIWFELGQVIVSWTCNGKPVRIG